MQAQALIYRRRSFSLAIAMFATLVTAAFGLALVVGNHPAVVFHSETSFAQHQQAPDAAERNSLLRAAQSDLPLSDLTRALPTAAPVVSVPNSSQSPDAKDRNGALSQGK
jgi:hypothetical protein